MELTQQILKMFLHYDEDTGVFTRLISTGNCLCGEVAGSIMKTGYVRISLLGNQYKAHRLAFLYMEGSIPDEIDHVNRIRSDNKWCNLRKCTRTENMRNRKDNIVVVVNGEEVCLKQACKLLNLNYITVQKRIKESGLTPEEAISIQIYGSGKNDQFYKALREFRESKNSP